MQLEQRVTRSTGPVLIFDGDCAFCTSCAAWARRHLKGGVVTAPWRELDLAVYGLFPADAIKAAWWVDPDGRRRRGYFALAKVLQESGGAWRALAAVFLAPPLRWIGPGAYGLVARHRHRLPGATPACRPMPAELGPESRRGV